MEPEEFATRAAKAWITKPMPAYARVALAGASDGLPHPEEAGIFRGVSKDEGSVHGSETRRAPPNMRIHP